MSMYKYGVDEGVNSEELEKKASQGCPKCGRTDLVRNGNTLLCPEHGSEPFETERKT